MSRALLVALALGWALSLAGLVLLLAIDHVQVTRYRGRRRRPRARERFRGAHVRVFTE